MTSTASMNVVSSRTSVWQRIRRIWNYRELLVGLIRKELKVRYKNSALGFVWSMLNPALYLVVFYIVFQLILGSGIPYFPIFLLSGLLVWNLFSSALPAACSSIVTNSSIVKKVSFPREILPLASVGASLIHFFLQGVVLIAALVIFRWNSDITLVPLLIAALATLLMFTGALAVLLAAINVNARDTQHFLELLLLAWFWCTPIVYQYRLVTDKVAEHPSLPSWLPLLNPITPIVLTFQRVLYNTYEANGVDILPHISGWTLLQYLGIVFGISSILFLLALSLFGRLEGNFAEEL